MGRGDPVSMKLNHLRCPLTASVRLSGSLEECGERRSERQTAPRGMDGVLSQSPGTANDDHAGALRSPVIAMRWPRFGPSALLTGSFAFPCIELASLLTALRSASPAAFDRFLDG